MDLTLANYFVFDKSGEESIFPQMGSRPNSNSLAFQSVYWQCLTLYFWSARAFHPNASLVLFLNQEPPGEFENFISTWRPWGVDVRIVPFTHRPPKNLVASFANSFYLLNVLEAASQDPRQSNWVFADPDCVFRRSIEHDLSKVESEGAIYGFDIGYPEDKGYNGLSRRHLFEFATNEGYEMKDTMPVWFGGEFVSGSSATIRKLIPTLLEVQEKNLSKWKAGERALQTEEQLLSVVLGMGIVPVYKANDFVRRLWTTLKYSNICGDESNLAFWHLPGEKKFGLRRLFRWLSRNNFQHSDDMSREFVKRLSVECGIPKLTTGKFVVRVGEKLIQKLAG